MKKSYCQDCICLVEGQNGEWICDEKGIEISAIKRCPETGYVPSSENGDYGPSNPWDAPGMSVKDFI